MGRVIKAGVFVPVSFEALERQMSYEAVQEVREPTPEEIAASALDRARTEADMIVRTARAEAESILREAREAGYLEGYQAGKSEGEALVAPLMQRLEADLVTFEAEAREFFESIEPGLLKLCLESVEKIVRHEARTDPRVVGRVIRSCLRRVKGSHEVRVRVNPAEVAAVRAMRDELLGMAEGVDAINIVDDRRVTAGGCVIETATGDFDATVETQLERIDQKLTETFENDRIKTCPGPGEVSEGSQPDGHGTS